MKRLLLDACTATRADAQAANQLKDEFLASLSHELRTPLTALLGWIQLLRSGHQPSRRGRHVHRAAAGERIVAFVTCPASRCSTRSAIAVSSASSCVT